MTKISLGANRLAATGRLDSSAGSGGLVKPRLIARLDLSGAFPDQSMTPGKWNQWDSFGSATTIIHDGTYNYLRCAYDDSRTGDGTCEPHVNYYLPCLMYEIYVQFWARKTAGGGCKFVKFFSETSNGRSNATFAMDYASGSLGSISYGDGTTTDNDSTKRIDAWSPPDWVDGRAGVLPRTYVHGGSFPPSEWGDGTQWHKFQLKLKQNSGTTAGNETNDGVIEMWIDGVLRNAGYNLFNRHYSNLGIEMIEFLSLSQAAAPFTLDMRDITISKNGWID